MEIKFFTILIAALVPFCLGVLWYGPLFGKHWAKEVNFTRYTSKSSNMVIYSVCFLCSFMIAFAMQMLVIHQWGIYSTLAGEPGFSEQTGKGYEVFTDLMNTYGNRFRTFKHGMLHGFLFTLFIVFPIMSIKTLFEKRTFKYLAINITYWGLVLSIMGGVICKWG